MARVSRVDELKRDHVGFAQQEILGEDGINSGDVWYLSAHLHGVSPLGRGPSSNKHAHRASLAADKPPSLRLVWGR